MYGGAALAAPGHDTRTRVGDPTFLGAITGPCGTEHSGPRLDRALPLRVAAASPAVDAGLAVPDNGGVDHSGRRVHGLPDIGAFEYRPRT